MTIEIERRFLVRGPFAAIGADRASSSHVIQGYFGCIDRLRVRVRVLSDEHNDCKAFLTFKGARFGYCRLEYEYSLELERARRALDALPSTQIIRKRRYNVRHHDGLVWSVDQFEGANSGLVLAEVELAYSNQEIEIPSWVGKEITFDPRYCNSQLARTPMPLLADAA